MIIVDGRSIIGWFLGGMVLLTAGCADLDIFPAWMPFQGPVSDTMPGVVPPGERIVKIQKLSAEAGSASPEQKRQVSQQLAQSIRDEKDPLIRMEILRALGHYPGPESDAVLKAAIADPDGQVRMAACDAFGKRHDAESVKLLSETLRSDVDADVRLTAALALGETKNPAAVPALGDALNDADPAMQYRAVLALKQVTGKDLGNDVRRWQQYVKGEPIDPPPSMAEQWRHLFF
ncbi:MAG: HEAT repeat domain-containing protein [Planctomycetaceae bacterium]|nr:HEAT repeat domain-containing protein [Planctomycetaceae bacterium]